MAQHSPGAPSCSTLVPRRGWEARPSRDQFVRPDYDLPAILPLYGDRLMPDLKPPLVNSEVAQNSLGPQPQQRFAEFVGIKTPGPFYCVHQQPARGVSTR